MRYAIAFGVGAVLTTGGFLYGRWAITDFETRAQARIEEKKRTGELPPDANISNVGMTLPAEEMRQLRIGHILHERWFVWGPIVIVVCLGVAALFRRRV